jgi:hypothetical protein
MLSRCCNKEMFIVNGNENIAFYVCKSCNLACDIINYYDCLIRKGVHIDVTNAGDDEQT